MKNNIILLLSTFALTCAALEPVCVDLGEEFGPQTLKVTDDKVVWITQRGATEGYCEDAERLSRRERATRAFCKRFKRRGRGAYSTIYAPRAATDWLVDHNASKGKCTGRARLIGSDVRMAYTRTPPANAAIVVKTDAHGEDLSWKLEDLARKRVVASAAKGSYGDNRKYTRNLYLQDGEYELTIRDSVGDGLKGDGYYAIRVNGDEVLRGFGLFKKEAHLFKVGEAERTRGRPRGMSRRDVAWLKAHNERREEFHKDHRVSYVPLMWSQALKDKAEDFVDHALEDCGVEKLHVMEGLEEGENAFGDIGVQVRSPEEVLQHWTDKKKKMGYPDNDTLTQVEWRGSNYLGCATGYKTLRNGNICERHVCLYTPAGNCDMAAHNARRRRNWVKPTLEKYTKCGSRCPDDGCYVSDFDGQ